MERLVLASGSPRRRELLMSMGLEFDVAVADVDETTNASVKQAVEELALKKASAVRPRFLDRFILAADSLVCVQNVILGKPVNDEDACRMLKLLQGCWHEVYTGVCLVDPHTGHTDVRHSKTRVHFVSLSEKEILHYISTGEPKDKAGAYAIQGIAGMFVSEIQGSYSNVIGLPTSLVREMLLCHHYPFFN